MSVSFKKDLRKFAGIKIFVHNAFDILSFDHDCFIYEDIFSQVNTKVLEEKYSMLDQHTYQLKLVVSYLSMLTDRRCKALEILEKMQRKY